MVMKNTGFGSPAQTDIGGSTFVANEAIGQSSSTYGYIGTANGGALFSESTPLTISGSTFIANQAVGAPGGGSGDGGAIFDISYLNALNLSNSLLIGNNAIGGSTSNGEDFYGVGAGGGLVVFAGPATVDNTDFVGNQAIGGPASGAL
jgi:hypothetical protein